LYLVCINKEIIITRRRRQRKRKLGFPIPDSIMDNNRQGASTITNKELSHTKRIQRSQGSKSLLAKLSLSIREISIIGFF